MNLSRSRPFPSHDWGDPDHRGDRHCQTDGCSATWKAEYDDPPPWKCKRTPLKRGSGPKPVADGGRKNRRDSESGVKHIYGPAWRFASHLPCCVCGQIDGTPADHWKTVGAGGKDPANVIPVDADHNNRHDLGPDTWADTYDVDPQQVAWDVWEQFKTARPEDAEKLEDHLPERRAA